MKGKMTHSWTAAIYGEGPPLEKGKGLLVKTAHADCDPFFVCIDRLPGEDDLPGDGLWHLVSASELGGDLIPTLMHKSLYRV